MNHDNEINRGHQPENVVQHQETGYANNNLINNKPLLDVNYNTPANLATLIPKYCVWGMVVSGGASILYPFTICELAGASDFVNNYSQYFGTFTEQQMLEYARNFGNIDQAQSNSAPTTTTPTPTTTGAREQPLPRINPAPAAAAVPADNEDANNHDWLDTLGMVARALLLLSFIYVNGSLNRLFILVGFYFLIKYYLRQQNEINNANLANNRRPQQQPDLPQQPQPVNELNENQNQDGEANHLQRLMDAEINADQSNSSSSSNSEDARQRQSSNNSSVSLSINLVKALFTSLIPSPGQAVND